MGSVFEIIDSSLLSVSQKFCNWVYFQYNKNNFWLAKAFMVISYIGWLGYTALSPSLIGFILNALIGIWIAYSFFPLYKRYGELEKEIENKAAFMNIRSLFVPFGVHRLICCVISLAVVIFYFTEPTPDNFCAVIANVVYDVSLFAASVQPPPKNVLKQYNGSGKIVPVGA